MGAGPTPQQLAAGKRRAKSRFIQQMRELLPRDAVISGSTVSYAGRRAVIDTRVIRASNGDAAGWAIASVFRDDGSVIRSWNEPPWMAGGCDAASVAKTLREGA